MLFNNSSAEQDIPLIQILKKYSYNDIREELAEERYTYKEGIKLIFFFFKIENSYYYYLIFFYIVHDED